jgi:thiol-disulfide isomerase/thioredoxin
MKHRIGIAALLIVVAVVAAVVVVNLSSRSDESAGVASEAVAATADGSQEQATGDVEADYQSLNARMDELETKARASRSTDEQLEIIRQMDALLTEFVSKYSGTPQAAEKSFDAGMVSFSLQDPKKAIRYLETFVNDAVDPGRDKEAYAHFYLAEAYKQLGEYDDAEAEYKTIIANYADVDRRMTAMVQQNMAMLDSERKLKIGAPPIDFTVTSLNGEKLSPEKYKGKVLLLDFWATWCAPCRQEMPNVIKVYDKYNKHGFEIVGISLDRNRADLDRYLDKYDLEWPQFFDGKYWQNEVATLYGVKSIPATYLIDKKGNIRYKSIRGHQLELAVKELLDE